VDTAKSIAPPFVAGLFTENTEDSGLLPETEPGYTALRILGKVKPMKLRAGGAAFVLVGALALPTGSSDAQTNQTRQTSVVYNRDRTIQISRGEDGRTRTRIIIQKRSYLDPGTETFPGERVRNTGYIENPNQRASSVINNTSAGLLNTQSALPGPWTLPSKNNPWLGY